MIALVVIVPALLAGVWAGRGGRRRLHRFLMWSVVSVVVGYVVIYEASMLYQGGLAFLRDRIQMPESTYFTVVALHVLCAILALIVAGLAVGSGRRLNPDAPVDPGLRATHRTRGYPAFLLLVGSVGSGVFVYYLTFVYVAGT
ncbi:MAG: DUF420 domain-containing protein [Deltaproteobacteria bacterium]|nr:DUF420 domain-containing protein [Deltaproteobacteria bacterium]